ncbi:MAG: aminotransferase class IV family protein [Nitrososphaerota archaeon]|nr:aminotransferase class IV family protein [Nitrososphaerota archaeon]
MRFPSGGRRWAGGRRYEGSTLNLPLGIRLGDGVFETVRTYGGVPFELRSHIERMRRGAIAIGLSRLPSVPILEQGVLRSFRMRSRHGTSRTEWIIRPLLFSETTGWGFVVEVEPLVLSSLPSNPLVVGTSRVPHPESYLTPHDAHQQVKWLSRGPLAYALREARESGWDEALLIDSRRRYVEGTRSNLFAIRHGVLCAPGPEAGALGGVTRQLVLDLARRAGLRTAEESIPRSRLLQAEEVFLTSTLLGVAPVASIDGRPLGSVPIPGPVTRWIERGFAERIATLKRAKKSAR